VVLCLKQELKLELELEGFVSEYSGVAEKVMLCSVLCFSFVRSFLRCNVLEDGI
jgi:hypothetical protein